MSLNPSIDWQWATPSFVYGGLNRAKSGERYAAGKGINVCVALKNLGLDPLCKGFNFRESGSFITGALDERGVRYDFVTVDGAVRVNIKLYDDATGKMTELNQPGDYVPDRAVEELYSKILVGKVAGQPQSRRCERSEAIQHKQLPNTASGLLRYARNDGRMSRHVHTGEDILVLSGSMPSGVPADIYSRLCSAWPGITVLDTDGEALRLALTGEKPPFLIKPNLFELTSCFGVELSTKESIAAFCKQLIAEYGVGVICVSMGADGAMLVTGADAYYVYAPEVKVRGVQGAGDAMVAGLVYGLGLPAHELLRKATAAATATVVRDGTLMCTREGFEKYLTDMPVPVVVE